MSTVLVSGKLFRDPERKTSQAGKAFTRAKLKEGQGDNTAWWSVLAFGDAAEELAELGDGDAIAVSGSFKVELYDKNGETKISLSVLADRIISTRRKKKKMENVREHEASGNSQSSTFDDDVPF